MMPGHPILPMIPDLATFVWGTVIVGLAARSRSTRAAERVFAVVCGLFGLVALARVMGDVGMLDLSQGVAAVVLPCTALAGLALSAMVISPPGVHFPRSLWHLGAAAAASVLCGLSVAREHTILTWYGGVAVVIAALSPGWALLEGAGKDTAEVDHQADSLSTRLLKATGMLLAAFVISDLLLPTHPCGPLSFVFLPLFMMARAVFPAGDQRMRASTIPVFPSASILLFCLVPLAVGALFILTTPMTSSLGSIPWEKWGFATASAGSLILCLVGGTAVLRDTWRRDTTGLLVCIAGSMAGIMNLRDILGVFYPERLTDIVLMSDLFFSILPGLSVHLAKMSLGAKADREVVAFYAAGGLYAVSLLACATAPWIGRGDAGWLMHVVFVCIVLASFFRSLWILGRFVSRSENVAPTSSVRPVVYGFALAFAVILGSTVISSIWRGFTVYFLAWIPIALIAWGTGCITLKGLNEYMRRHIVSVALRAAIVAVYASALVWMYFLIRDLSPAHVLSRVVPYGVPPLLSFVSAAFLSLFVLALEKNRPESIPFSLICFCYALLNLDILAIAIIDDMETALAISRADHFFLAMVMLGANFHLAFLIANKKTGWQLVWWSYIFGAFMAPLTQTDWYFSGMYKYFWGYFAKKAVLYDVMSAAWMAALIYAIHLTFREFKRLKDDQRRRNTLKKVIISIILMAALSLTNTPAIYGREVYPLGTFIFIPLLYLTYSLFMYNAAMAVQYMRRIVFWVGFVAILALIASIPGAIMGWNRASFITGLLLAVVSHASVRKAWDAILNLFIRADVELLHESYRAFTSALSHVHRLDELHRIVAAWCFSEMNTEKVTSFFTGSDPSALTGWTSFNSNALSGLFVGGKDAASDESPLHVKSDTPLLEVCSSTRRILTKHEFLGICPDSLLSQEELGILEGMEMIMPVFSHDTLTAVILLGGKIDRSRYSRAEVDVLSDMALFLGPHVENAKLLEDLEGEVELRTKDLNEALIEAMIKERQIVERNALIERQNRISQVLLHTSTEMHNITRIDDLFSFVLLQMHALFPNLKGGIVLAGTQRGASVEASAFVNLSEEEQKVLLESLDMVRDSAFNDILSSAMAQICVDGAKWGRGTWKVFPVLEGQEGYTGWVILHVEDMDASPEETISLFVSQLSAVVYNRVLLANLERMASTDGLTGVYNRAFFDAELEKAVRHAKRYRDMRFSVMVIDVNGLKEINDLYGHTSGDKAIVQVASMLKSTCRDTDIVARIGGDEFAILMPSTNLVQAGILMERIRDAERDLGILVTPSEGLHVTIPVHISIGLASSQDDDPDLVLKIADDLMYADKQRYYAHHSANGPRSQGGLP